MKFSNLHREEIQQTLRSGYYDVLVIGGGITGAGIALDAVSRGMKTALVEMQDFAAGTSSRSTKLVHGGLRYLKQWEVKIVAEVGKERAIVYENGPHVTTPEWMLLPIYKGGTFGMFTTSLGLRLYDFLAKVKKSERRSMLTAAETMIKEPLIRKSGLKGGGYYVEYRTDDARLTIEVIKAAFEKGTIASNYTKIVELIYKNNKICGVVAKDLMSGETFKIRAKKVVNAAGPWVDTIRQMDQSKAGKTLQLSKGVHLVIDQSRFPLKQSVYFDTPDGRMMFAIPREGKTYVGTTDTFYDEDIVHPHITVKDCYYIINAIHYMFPDVNINLSDIESSWAGVRPLIHEAGKNPSDISRKDEIWKSDSGLITIAGGKLTGYRKMAETVVDLVAEQFYAEERVKYPGSQTKVMPISGGAVGGSKNFEAYIKESSTKGVKAGLTIQEGEKLTRLYGANAGTVFHLLEKNQEDVNKYGLPPSLFAKLVYGIEEEMTVTPIDFFYRRTGAILFNIDLVNKWKKQVIAYMGMRFNWTDHDKKNYSQELEEALKAAVFPEDREEV
ncbi:glycerol-3-phosphate dehydrogenase/oxidase [Neobacillus drentensis]|uniref:glycerol-3-phosphate dehydrogenase/oxidase n=1 Tax=Neobacillus drentensis TaxID=220684 RepID=UPI001F2D4A93|nr:glycerol-3-phosphate dehydrogenase/oxidase [Neobacillus drentensis]ULT58403.1 glycerol-3-phosphate dehydrogenase/oxidase [Neobacillus drentensis]